MSLKKFRSSWWPEVLFLTVISALVYLPQVGKLSFHSDDWYFIYNGLVLGAKSFIDLTLHTRPLRGPLYQLLFSVYGLSPLPYNLTLYFWRLLGGWGAVWLYNLLWRERRQANFFLAVLFVLFPGFLWWVSGFEFQPYVLSLTLQVFSIVFTLKAVEAGSLWKRAAWGLAALLSGWAYLGLVEFAIGMEAFRILAVFVFLKHNEPQAGFRKLSLRTARASAFFLAIPICFVVWYQFFFDNWRKAQQAGVQLRHVFQEPATVVSWVVGVFQGLLNDTLMAWTSPFNSNFYSGGARDFVLRFVLAAVVVALAWLVYYFFFRAHPEGTSAEEAAPLDWRMELLLVGLLGTLAGVFPVVLVNRAVTFSFSQYGLPASLAAVLIIGGFVYSVVPGRLRVAALLILVGLAALTHLAVADRAVAEEQSVYDFWWQVNWRAPAIKPGTTLYADYPFDFGDTDSLVWGPANFIYYRQSQAGSVAKVPLYAITRQPDTIESILTGSKGDGQNLIVTNSSYHYDFQNLLVLAQPSPDGCVRVIDSTLPEYSANDDGLTMIAGSYSIIENILPGAKPALPPQPPFGLEPAHTWCYFYEKAELARQQGNWPEVLRLAGEVKQKGLHPTDAIEWMPFVQAYAFAGDIPQLDSASKPLRLEPYYRKQACSILQRMNKGHPFAPAMLNEVNRLFCSN